MADTPYWLVEPALQHLFAHTREMGGEARVVGGAVRDFLLHRDGGDIDIASTLPPEATMAIAEAAGWKAVPTGLAHGTVTLVLPNRVVEVTTLRRDVETDGRHAQIAYTNDFAEDAARRDFTMNALFMDAAGTIHDYTGGQKDLEARRLVFIGDAETRITEDALRILRYFRFLATHGKPPADSAAVAACEGHKAMIANLSGERIAQEMRKLLTAANPAYALGQMAAIGLHEYLTESPWHGTALLRLLELEQRYNISPNGWVRLLALIAPDVRSETAHWIGERWKLSRAERLLLGTLAHVESTIDTAVVKEWLRAYDRPLVIGRLLLSAVDTEDANPITPLLELARQWPIPEFPVSASDLLRLGYSEGKELGDALRVLERRWVDSGYQLTRQELLA